jgi:P27 family predicted phage terminase small subunit
MTRGRKAEPAQAHALAGTFRADRHEGAAKVELGIPDAPRWLGKDAKKHWDVIGPLLYANGLIALVDQDMFALHCDTMERLQKVLTQIDVLAAKSTDGMGGLIGTTPNGYAVQDALFTIRSKLIEQAHKSAQLFGMSPAARTSIKATNQGSLFDPVGNPFNEFAVSTRS